MSDSEKLKDLANYLEYEDRGRLTTGDVEIWDDLRRIADNLDKQEAQIDSLKMCQNCLYFALNQNKMPCNVCKRNMIFEVGGENDNWQPKTK